MRNTDKKSAGLILLILSILAAIFAAADYANIFEAPAGLGANSWMLIAIGLGLYAQLAKQWS